MQPQLQLNRRHAGIALGAAVGLLLTARSAWAGHDMCDPSKPDQQYRFPDPPANPPIVRDCRTNITWQGGPAPGTYTWTEALSFCANLPPLFGTSQWRLPTAKELQSLLDDSAPDVAIDQTFFPNVTPEEFWSSTPDPRFTTQTTTRVWAVSFAPGAEMGDVLLSASPAPRRRVLCRNDAF